MHYLGINLIDKIIIIITMSQTFLEPKKNQFRRT